MNIRTIAIAIASFALLGLTACTPEEIQQAIEFSDAQAGIGPAAVETSAVETSPATEPVPTIEVTATCETVRIVMTGWPAGNSFATGIGGQPPYGFDPDENGDVDWTLTRNQRETGLFEWSVWSTTELSELDLHGDVACP